MSSRLSIAMARAMSSMVRSAISSLQRELDSNSGEKCHKCDQCGYATEMIMHIRKHSTEREISQMVISSIPQSISCKSMVVQIKS